MQILEFISKFSKEQSCKEYFRDIQMKGEMFEKNADTKSITG